jgi:hypothetical protein
LWSLQDRREVGMKNLLTEYQHKGLLLEVATFLALKKLGIHPYPLHNPFTSEYANDQHLKVDLIFIFQNQLIGVECKNYSYRSHIGVEFWDEEVFSRFDNTDLPFYKKIVLFGVTNFRGTNYIPREYDILTLGYQVNEENFKAAISDLAIRFSIYLDKLIPKIARKSVPSSAQSKLLLSKGDSSIVYSLHGYTKNYKANKVKLDRIDKRLRSKDEEKAS